MHCATGVPLPLTFITSGDRMSSVAAVLANTQVDTAYMCLTICVDSA